MVLRPGEWRGDDQMQRLIDCYHYNGLCKYGGTFTSIFVGSLLMAAGTQQKLIKYYQPMAGDEMLISAYQQLFTTFLK